MAERDVQVEREHEWQAALKWLGLGRLVWVVIKLLIRKNVFTADELCDAAQAEAGMPQDGVRG